MAPPRFPVNIGDKYKKWTVISSGEACPSSRQIKYLCKCECGTERYILSKNLRRPDMCFECISCRNQSAKHKSKLHGLSNSRVYNVWHGMKQRCTLPSNPNWHLYGGNGIKVCDRWMIFQNFFDDMGHPPEGHQLDRIDPHGHYEPTNCRWVTSQENNNNRRNAKKYRGQYIYVRKSDLCQQCLDRTLSGLR